MNYTSFDRGINGIMIDIAELPGASTAADFVFKAGNDEDPDNWDSAPDPISVTVTANGDEGNSSRVVIVWEDHAIENTWLQVTVKDGADSNTGLAAADVFYFGNLIGESGDSSSIAAVDINDEIASRTHKTGFSAADIANKFDYNRDCRVNATDDLIARFNASHTLQLITAPAALAMSKSDEIPLALSAAASVEADAPEPIAGDGDMRPQPAAAGTFLLRQALSPLQSTNFTAISVLSARYLDLQREGNSSAAKQTTFGASLNMKTLDGAIAAPRHQDRTVVLKHLNGAPQASLVEGRLRDSVFSDSYSFFLPDISLLPAEEAESAKRAGIDEFLGERQAQGKDESLICAIDSVLLLRDDL